MAMNIKWYKWNQHWVKTFTPMTPSLLPFLFNTKRRVLSASKLHQTLKHTRGILVVSWCSGLVVLTPVKPKNPRKSKIYLPWKTHPCIKKTNGHRWTHIQSWLMDIHVGWLHVELDTATSATVAHEHGINIINNVAKCCRKPALGHPICGSIINLLSAWHLREPDRWRRTWIMRLGSSQRLDICFLNKLRFNAFYGSSVSRLWNASCYGSDSLTSKIHLHQILHLQIAYLLVPKMHVQFLNLNVQWHKGQEICIPATRYAFSSPQDFQICILEWYQK